MLPSLVSDQEVRNRLDLSLYVLILSSVQDKTELVQAI